MYRVLLVKLTTFDHIILKEVICHLRKLGFEVHYLNEVLHLNMFMFNWDRLQYDAEKIINYLSERFSNFPYDSIIAIGHLNAYINNEKYVVGLHKEKIGIVFSYKYEDEKGSIDKFVSRVKKEIVHEIGHTLGLNDCSTPSCVMNKVNSVEDIDKKGYVFCPKCTALLLNINNKG